MSKRSKSGGSLVAEAEPKLISGWISMTDQFPSDLEECIVCLANRKIFAATYIQSRFYSIGIGFEMAENPVTHWMPLPEAPSEIM
jgi:hypothetical protein